MGHQALAALRLLDQVAGGQQAFEIAIFENKLGAGLEADAGDARNIVDRIAGQRLDIDHLVRGNAEFLDDLGFADLAVLHGVEERDAVADELHQVLVRGHDPDLGAGGTGKAGIGGDEIVGLEALLLDAGTANALTAWRMIPNWGTRSEGGSGRWAL